MSRAAAGRDGRHNGWNDDEKTLVCAAIATLAGIAHRASAQEAGWAVDTSKPKRAILSYTAEKDGPRLLIVACLRDSEEIGLYSTGIGAPSGKPVVVMGLTNAGRKYSVRGGMGLDNTTNQPAFRYETNIDFESARHLPRRVHADAQRQGTADDHGRRQVAAGAAHRRRRALQKFSATCFGKS